jgi:hypothetical protein
MADDYRSRGCFAHRSDLLLEQGNIYFSVQFVDEDILIPIRETWVFAGRNLDPEDAENHLYFRMSNRTCKECATALRLLKMPRSKLLLRRTRSTF